MCLLFMYHAIQVLDNINFFQILHNDVHKLSISSTSGEKEKSDGVDEGSFLEELFPLSLQQHLQVLRSPQSCRVLAAES